MAVDPFVFVDKEKIFLLITYSWRFEINYYDTPKALERSKMQSAGVVDSFTFYIFDVNTYISPSIDLSSRSTNCEIFQMIDNGR